MAKARGPWRIPSRSPSIALTRSWAGLRKIMRRAIGPSCAQLSKRETPTFPAVGNRRSASRAHLRSDLRWTSASVGLSVLTDSP
jgi:hypothetical protein